MALGHRVRLAYCLDSFSIGGTELNAVRTAEALDLERFDLRVFFLQDRGPLRSRYERLGVPLTHVPIRNLYSPRTAIRGARLARSLHRQDVHVVHSHDIYCNIFAVPWVRLLSSCAVIASRRWGRTASRPELSTANRWSSRLAHRVLANSNAVAELVVREESVPRGKVVEIPNFIDDDAFEPAQPAEVSAQRRSWGLPQDAFVIGIVARLSPVKNHAVLLEALAMLDERAHLVLIGDGPLRGELHGHALRLGIAPRVFFAGEVSSERNLHRFFDASVLCSLSEGFPNSLIEAMAAGRPVVATPVGGVPDAVTHEVSGLLVPAGEPNPLALALRRLQHDAALRERLGDAGRQAARVRFRRNVVVDKVAQLYEDLAARRGARP